MIKQKLVRLDDETLAVFRQSRIEGNNLFLPATPRLERALYLKVAKAIEAAGGKWNKKSQCHVFPDDVRKTLDIKDDTVAVVNIQQTYQAFYTPVELANQVVQLAGIQRGQRVLEPSAGNGALIRALPHDIDLVAVEINEKEAGKIPMPPGHLLVVSDFLQCNGDLGQFDRVVMNPPFTKGQDVKHIKHALKMLKPGGRLVSICGNGPKQRAALEDMALQWIDVPAGAFKESGTNVSTAIVVIEP